VEPGKRGGALAYALKVLTRGRKTRCEVEGKLLEKGYPRSAVEGALADLERWGYIDDSSFCRAWLEERLRQKPMGRRRLALELLMRGVNETVVKESLSRYYPADEYELALDAARKRISVLKMGGKGPLTDRDRRRLAAFLERRGFETWVIARVLEEVF